MRCCGIFCCTNLFYISFGNAKIEPYFVESVQLFGSKFWRKFWRKFSEVANQNKQTGN